MKLYANEKNIKLVASMIQKRREPHSIVICGEHGQGRKTLARYIAMQLMCERHGERPCGECRACRMIEHGTHPDFVVAKANDNGNYQVDTIRELAADAVIKPSEADYRVFVIPDLDRSVNTAVQVQNILLKSIEEPPPHCVIILTAASKQVFLQTIISRVLCLTAEPCTEEQASQWLRENGYREDSIAEAVDCCHGNIGRCVEYIAGGELPQAFYTAKLCCDAMVNRDEFMLLKAFFNAEGKKAVIRQTLVFLQEIVRDICAVKLGIPLSGCCKSGSEKLADIISEATAEELYELLGDYIKKIDSNCNLTLTVNSLTGELIWLICRRT